jgi:dihydrolipoamide dehydrogenase
MSEKYDVVVIGSGPGGYVAASRLGGMKKRVALVEFKDLGGTCLNCGCIPTKTLLHSSQIVANLSHAGSHGIEVDGWKVNLAKMIERKNEVVKKLRAGVGGLMKNKKVDVFQGKGKLLEAHKVEVQLSDGGTTVLETENIIIATGSEPTVPGVFPQERNKVMTSDEILDLTQLPESLMIVGGGVIGCEFATVFSELGTKVTVVEMMDRILPMADADISKALTRKFKSMGIEVLAGTAVEKMDLGGQGVQTAVAGSQVFDTTLALVCTGRRPFTDDLGLEAVGVTLEKGFVAIDENCRTNVPNIFAIGDVTGKLQLAHVAYRQAAVATNIISGTDDREDYRVVPSAVYTHPEVAWVGLTEEEAKELGIKIKKGSMPMSVSGLALAYDETIGLVKILADEDDAIVGAHMMCPHASDAIQEIAVLMKSECTLHELEATIHGHPTFSESLGDVTGSMLGVSGH